MDKDRKVRRSSKKKKRDSSESASSSESESFSSSQSEESSSEEQRRKKKQLRQKALKKEIEELKRKKRELQLKNSSSVSQVKENLRKVESAIKKEESPEDDEEIKRMRAELEEQKRRKTELATMTSTRIANLSMAAEKEAQLYNSERIDKARLSDMQAGMLASKLRAAQQVDLCFMFDCTGSMGAYLTEAKNRAVTMEGELRKNFPYLEMKVAFVGYRDITDSNRFEIMEFTDNSQDLQRFITGISPTGGGDTPEDILGGLKKVLDLSWRRPTRLLLHVADAPCHGKQYHDCDDSYPGGDPTGLTPDHLLPLLATQKIEYFFFKINSSTDKMMSIFERIYNGASKGVTNLEILAMGDAKNMMSCITKSVTASIARSELKFT